MAVPGRCERVGGVDPAAAARNIDRQRLAVRVPDDPKGARFAPGTVAVKQGSAWADLRVFSTARRRICRGKPSTLPRTCRGKTSSCRPRDPAVRCRNYSLSIAVGVTVIVLTFPPHPY